MKILFLITARGGSKGVPGKNLRKLGGIPLVGFKAISAKRSQYCSRLIISTDDEEIQTVACGFGAEVPFTRPSELATDTASSMDVLVHAMDYIDNETNEKYDALMLLEPSSPFATHLDYDDAVKIMMRHEANVVVSVGLTVPHSSKHGTLDAEGKITRPVDRVNRYSVRQEDEPEYALNGALYLMKWDFFKERRRIMGDIDHTFAHVMDQAHSVEIDEIIDLAWAEFLVENGYVDLSYWQQEAPGTQRCAGDS